MNEKINGRPTKLTPWARSVCIKLSEYGLRDVDIEDILGVSKSTLNYWRHMDEGFSIQMLSAEQLSRKNGKHLSVFAATRILNEFCEANRIGIRCPTIAEMTKVSELIRFIKEDGNDY